MDNKEFSLDRESYEDNYLRFFQQKNLSPRSLIQFVIELPFDLAFPDPFRSTFSLEKEACSFKFMRLNKEKEYIITENSIEDKNPIPYKQTLVEMSLFTEKIYYSSENDISIIFDFLLLHLNYLISSYSINTKQIDIHKISKEMLAPFIICRQIDLPNFTNENLSIFGLHINIAYEKDELEIEDFENISHFAHAVRDNLNPFFLTQELMMNSYRQFTLGFYKEAVIDSQTSIESFLRTSYSEMLKIENKSESEILEIQENTPFKSMVRKEFSKRIGGSWDLTNTYKPIGSWYKRCYELRNKIIHTGYQPSYEETQKAVYAADDFRNFFKTRIDKSKKYKVINQYI